MSSVYPATESSRDHFPYADFPLLITAGQRQITTVWPAIRQECCSLLPTTPFIANFRLADDTEVHHPKPTSRRTGISAVAGPTALTLVDFVQSIPIPIPSHLLAQPTKIPSYMGVLAGYNRFQLAS